MKGVLLIVKLEELLELQKELDDYIIEQKHLNLGNKELLIDTLLALQVEVSELANATRCFKHWSNKKSESKEIVLDEYVDILHFWLSIGNQLNFKPKEIEDAYLKKRQINVNRVIEGY